MAISALPVVAVAAPATAAPVATTAGPSDMVGWVNTLRANAGVAALGTDTTLNSVAQQWANHMASTGALAHNPNLSTQAPSGWTKMGENIGEGYSLTAVYNALVASPDHHANMVDRAYNRTGVGVATDAKGQVWVAEDFGAYPPPAPAPFVFPTTGTVIFPSPQTFSWSQAPGAQYYYLTVGTTKGGYDLVNSGLIANSHLSYSVPAMPGSTPLWARVYTYNQNAWVWTDASFSVTGPATATFTWPTPAAVNITTSQPFTWTAVASASYYGIAVGTTRGKNDVYSTGPLASNRTSFTLPALPTGKVLWARLYSYIDGSWNHYTDVSFTAS